MFLVYVRHGDPIYNPDSITPLGERQAEALARRIARFGIDEIYSSPFKRAQMTARPTAELCKKEVIISDIFSEGRIYHNFACPNDNGVESWFWNNTRIKELMTSDEVVRMGGDWYKHPELAQFEKAIVQAYDELDAFLLEQGYEHIRGTGKYKIVKPSDKRIAIFAHHGYGLAFLSCLFDIPYPRVYMHFDIRTAGVTAIHFKNSKDGYCTPVLTTLSNDAHLYAENLPTKLGEVF